MASNSGTEFSYPYAFLRASISSFVCTPFIVRSSQLSCCERRERSVWVADPLPSALLVLLSHKVAFWQLGIVDNFGRFVFRHEELRWITQKRLTVQRDLKHMSRDL